MIRYNNKVIKVVWLDLDDTVIDFQTNSRNALQRLRDREEPIQRLFPTAGMWIDTYENHNRELWRQYGAGEISRSYLRMERFRRPLTDAGMTGEDAMALSERYDTDYLDILATERQLVDGSIDLLRYLKKNGVVTGCLSNGFSDVQFRKLRNCGLEEWFDIVVLSDDIGINKPDRRLFSYAMERSGILSPTAHLMIGDNAVSDIGGALGAGWEAIHYMATADAETHPECSVRVGCLQEIIHILDNSRQSAESTQKKWP